MNNRTLSTLIAVVTVTLLALFVSRRTPTAPELSAAAPSASEAQIAPISADPTLDPPLADASWTVADFAGWTRTEVPAAREELRTAHVRVRVLDMDSVPLNAAELAVDDLRSVWRRVDKSGEVGLLVHPKSLLVARCQGMATAHLVVPDPVPEALEVRLQPGGTIQGRVAWENGDVAEEGAVVLAWRDGRIPTTAAIQRHAIGAADPSLASSHVDARGRFVIGGLPLGSTWTVTAVAPGGVCSQRSLANVDDDEVAIQLRPTYACAVRLVERGGARLEGDQDVFGRGLVASVRVPGVHMDSTQRVQVELAMLGLTPEFTDSSSARDRRVVLLYRHSREPELGPVAFAADVPGYRPVWTAMVARPVCASIPTFQIEMERDAVATGDLVVRLQGSGVSLVGEPRDASPIGCLTLKDPAGGRHLSLRLSRATTNEWRFTKLPVGSYRVRFNHDEGGYEWPPADTSSVFIDIVEGTTELSVPMEDTGALLLLAMTDSGAEYDGPLLVSLLDRRSRVLHETYLSGAPYALEGIPGGSYEVGIRSAKWRQRATGEQRFIEIRPRAVCEHVLDMH